MKTKMKMIVLSIVMFVAGIAATCMIGRFIIMPDIAKDISKLGILMALKRAVMVMISTSTKK